VVRLLLQRILEGLVALVLVVVIVFLMGRVIGNPVDALLPSTASAQERHDLYLRLGLDRPVPEQLVDYFGMLMKGDLGQSPYSGLDVSTVLKERLPNSIELAVSATALSILVSVPLAVLAASRRNSKWDHLAGAFALGGQAAPPFWLGLILIFIFAVRFQVLPAAGTGSLEYLVLPSLTLGWFLCAGLIRLLRGALVEVLSSDYVLFARSLGLPNWRVVWVYALPNAIVSALTFLGFMFGVMIAGAVVVETVFVWPGLGQLAYQAILDRDFAVLQGVVLVWAILIVVANIAVDIAYGAIDPRVRAGAH
jgi:peptide/nickel transport system permease protein